MQDTKQIVKNVRKIEIKTKHLVDGLLQGAYHSIFKGQGVEFSEVREYQYGDDVRSIDWNVTARFNHPYIKEFIEERDLTVYIAFDVSGSGDFGFMKSKKDVASEIAASLMFAAMRNNDRVGLLLFTDKAEKYLAPRKGKKHILRLIREIIYYQPKSKATNLRQSLEFLSKIAKKRSIIFILSDFLFESMDFDKPLKILKNRYEIIALNLSDIREIEIPDIGYIELEDEETGEQILVNTSDKNFRENYSRQIFEKNKLVEKIFKKIKIDQVNIKTDEPFEIPLRKFFRSRRN